MNLRYTLTRDMLVQLTEFLLMRGPGFAEAQWTARKRSALWMAFWLLNLFIYAVTGLVAEDNWLRFWVLPSIIFFGINLYNILFDTGQALKLVRKRAVQEVDRRPADERSEEVDFRATADYFLASTPRAQLALRPDQIRSIYYDDLLLYLFYQSDRALVIPQAAFAGEEARNALFNHLYSQNPPLYQATHRLVIKDLVPKEGLFDSPVKIVAGSLGLIGLGLILFMLAGPLIFEKYVESIQAEADGETGEYDFTAHLPRVDDAAALDRLSREERVVMAWTPVAEISGPKKQVRCLVSLNHPERPPAKAGASPEQLAAFTFMKKEYGRLKPRIMAALLAAHERRQADLAAYQGYPPPSKPIPEIKSPEDLARRLTLRGWTIFGLSRDGVAFVSLSFTRDWSEFRYGHDFGVLLLGDEIIYAGRQPELYLGLDLDKEPLAVPAPPTEPAPAAEAPDSEAQAREAAPNSP